MKLNVEPVTTIKTEVAKVRGEPKSIDTLDLIWIRYATRTQLLD